VQRELQHAEPRVAGAAANPRASFERDVARGISEPGNEPPEKQQRPHARDQCVHDGAGQQPEIRRAGLYGRATERNEYPIEHSRRPALQEALAVGLEPNPLHDLAALLPLLHELRDAARRVLTVAIHRENSVAPGCDQTGQNRRLLTEIPRQPDAGDLRVQPRQSLDDRPRGIPAAVVHHDDLAGQVAHRA